MTNVSLSASIFVCANDVRNSTQLGTNGSNKSRTVGENMNINDPSSTTSEKKVEIKFET